jgi:hypothetical protein
MPRKKRLGIVHRRALALLDLTPSEWEYLSAGWSPPRATDAVRCGRWRTWDEFMADYASVREEFLAAGDLSGQPPRVTPFAEWLYQRTAGDPDRVANLERAGASIVAETVRRYPATLLDPVYALYREEVRDAA